MRSTIRPTTPLTIERTGTRRNLARLPRTTADAPFPALAIVTRLCRALDEEEITYCHWKSNNALDRSASGQNDLDLLISRADALKFAALLHSLGFKQVEAPPDKEMPGVLDYFGYDEQARKLIHVHAHFQLSMGHDLTKNYRLPIEDAYLESSVQEDLFRVPTPEFEFMVFVIRMILKHSTWDDMLIGDGHLKSSERRELAWLLERIDKARVRELVKQHLPGVGGALFTDCVRALEQGCPAWVRIWAGQRLQSAMRANARVPAPVDTYLKFWRKGSQAIYRRIVRSSPKYRLPNGGTMVALIGGDGAGKSTAIEAIHDSLSKTFNVKRVHMGKPGWSPLTMVIRAALKVGQIVRLYPLESSLRETLKQESPVSPGYPWLIREVCTARDRYRDYVKARRFAARGGIVLFDRFPLRQVRLMDGPQCERFVRLMEERTYPGGAFQPRPNSRLAKVLIRLEQRYYDRITPPELLVVLRVDPRIAVARKTGDDPAFVRERSTEVWEVDWEDTSATVVDAGKPRAAVAAELKSLIWAHL